MCLDDKRRFNHNSEQNDNILAIFLTNSRRCKIVHWHLLSQISHAIVWVI